MFKVTSNVGAVLLDMKGMAPQARFGLAVALTRTAQDVMAGLYAEMDRVWDRPGPFSKRSLFVKPATKVNLQASVEIKDRFPSKATYSPDETYRHQFFDGQRKRKGIERYAERAGLISSSEWLVPASGAKLDAYGNMSRGQVAQVMSQLRLGLDAAAWRSNSARSTAGRKKSGTYFWSRGGHLKRGVWWRSGSSVRPVMIVVRSVHYQPRMDMARVGEAVASARLEGHVTTEVARAWATAR